MADEPTPPPEGPPPQRVVRDTAEQTRRLRWEARTSAAVTDLQERVAALDAAPGIPENLVETVGELREAVDRLEQAAARVPDPFHWDDINDPGVRAEREGDLLRWWSDVVVVWCPRHAADVLGCWFEHLPARRVVTECWLAWLGAHRVRGRKHSDPATWARVNLPQMVAGVGVEIGSVLEGCDDHPNGPPDN